MKNSKKLLFKGAFCVEEKIKRQVDKITEK